MAGIPWHAAKAVCLVSVARFSYIAEFYERQRMQENLGSEIDPHSFDAHVRR